jgi:hypothetical protein
VILSSLATAVMLAASHEDDSTAADCDATRIVVRDAAGRIRIVIGSPLLLPGMDSSALHFMPEAGIFCYDEEGRCLAELSEGSLSLTPADGNGWAVLGTNLPWKAGVDDPGGGFLHLFSAEDHPTRLLLQAKEGEPAIELYRERDRLELRLPE